MSIDTCTIIATKGVLKVFISKIILETFVTKEVLKVKSILDTKSEMLQVFISKTILDSGSELFVSHEFYEESNFIKTVF